MMNIDKAYVTYTANEYKVIRIMLKALQHVLNFTYESSQDGEDILVCVYNTDTETIQKLDEIISCEMGF